MRRDCVLCKIGSGQIPSQRIHEDGLTVAFLDVDQINPGHVVVAVKPHVEAIVDLSPEEALAVFHTASRVARAVASAFKPAGLMILQTSGAAAGQTVSHLHLHVLPRTADDGVAVTWPRRNFPADELAKLADQLRKVFAREGNSA
jgi:histidine triad (HIT) family protein